jgi:hypothetical protein
MGIDSWHQINHILKDCPLCRHNMYFDRTFTLIDAAGHGKLIDDPISANVPIIPRWNRIQDEAATYVLGRAGAFGAEKCLFRNSAGPRYLSPGIFSRDGEREINPA